MPKTKYITEIFHDNIADSTIDNKNYRKAVYTVPNSIQLVYMSLKPGESVPREIHPHTSQFIRIESGNGEAIIEYGDETRKYRLKDDTAIIIPPGLYHTIKNTGDEDLKLYTVYTPPNHPSNALEKVRTEETND